MKFLISLAGFSLALSSAHGASFVVTDTVTSVIPDGSSSGLTRQLTVNAPGESITSLQVNLSLAAVSGDAAFLGDLFIYLSHGSDLAVLMNRPGRLATSSAGYGDNQSLNVTFADSAVGDIHNYRLVLNGSHATPLTGPLTGNWQPDGRATDPATVLNTDARTATFSNFTGDAASGVWSLFAADLSTGATHQITSWTLTINTVPEPSTAALLLPLGLAAVLRRKRSC